MDFELIFSIAGLLAMAGWVILLLSPFMPLWSDRIAGLIIPIALALGYVAMLIFSPAQEGGGFGSFAEVAELFTNPGAVMAGWIHFLAFDLLIGAWICRTGRRENIRFWVVALCLPLTFMLGPAGFLLFSVVRGIKGARKPDLVVST
ncbi:MAG: ABA4-like family protein [Bacteroidota bacterium]